MRHRHVQVTSRGTGLRDFSADPGVPRSGPRLSPFPMSVLSVAKHGYFAVSIVKSTLQLQPLLFPQDGNSSVVFQNLPQSAQAPKRTRGGTNIIGFTATVQSTDFH